MSEAGTQTITAATKIGTNPDNRFRQATSNRGSRGIRDQPRNSPTHTEKRIRISPAFPWSSRGQLPPGRVGSFRGYPLLTILLAAVKAWSTLDRVAQIGAEWDRQTRKLDNACPAGRKSGGWRVADGRWRMAEAKWRMAEAKWRMAEGQADDECGGELGWLHSRQQQRADGTGVSGRSR